MKRVYDQPKTALDRLIDSAKGHPEQITHLLQLREASNPFKLARTIEDKMRHIQKLATRIRPTTEKTIPNTLVDNKKRANPEYLFGKKPWYSLGSLLPKSPEELRRIAMDKRIRKDT